MICLYHRVNLSASQVAANGAVQRSKCSSHELKGRPARITPSGVRHTEVRLCFERARLQSCRKRHTMSWALAPEGSLFYESIPFVGPHVRRVSPRRLLALNLGWNESQPHIRIHAVRTLVCVDPHVIHQHLRREGRAGVRGAGPVAANGEVQKNEVALPCIEGPDRT